MGNRNKAPCPAGGKTPFCLLDNASSAVYNNNTLWITYCYYMEATGMPAVKKVSKEKIIDAAVEVLRDGGFSAINARSVAKKLGCSTQPIYLSFQSMVLN